MIGYTTLGTNDIKKATAFYDTVFNELGIKRLWDTEGFVGYGPSMDKPMFAVCNPFNKEPATPGNGTMIAVAVMEPEQVHKVHAAALKAGATDEGAPGPRGDTFYCGYFRDLDGNKINAFCMMPSK